MNRKGLSDENALNVLGGYSSFQKYNKTVICTLLYNNDTVMIKYSQLYTSGDMYWYGITNNTMKNCVQYKVKYFVLILGYEGIIKLPISILQNYLSNADITYKENKEIKHYHLRIKFDGEQFYLYNTKERIALGQYYLFDQEIMEEELEKKTREDILKEALEFIDYEEQYVVSNQPHSIRKESQAQKNRVALLENYTCQVCGFHESYINSRGKIKWIIEVDHIIDKAIGGGESIDNLWVLCPNCHSKKTRQIITIEVNNRVVRERGVIKNIYNNHWI